MPVVVREDDWETPQQFDAVQRLADAIDAVISLADALKTSGAAYALTLENFADDAAAAMGGVQVGHLYRNGSIIRVRVS